MGGIWTQLFPPAPTFTETNIPSQAGKVIIVTGGNAGVGFEVVKILYTKGATIYIAARSQQRIDAAIRTIQSTPTTTPGQLKSLLLDLGDLTTIAPAVSTFLAQENRLDILFNNAGISMQSPGSTSAQGHEAHMGTNCLGPHLLTKLLLSTLIRTARSAPQASVRIIWTSSGVIDLGAPRGGLLLEDQEPGNHNQDKMYNYAASKAGNWFQASELDRRVREQGIVSIALNPGTLKTKGWDKAPLSAKVLMGLVMHEPVKGAYTTLWAGLSEDVGLDDGGRFAIPWGRWHPAPRRDVLDSVRAEEEGGTGLAKRFWEWCEGATAEFVGEGR